MNFLTEDHFNAAMQQPAMAAEVLKMLMDDMAICIAILGGPEGTEDTYQKIIFRMRMELLTGAIVAKNRLDDHLSGRAVMHPKVVLPH